MNTQPGMREWAPSPLQPGHSTLSRGGGPRCCGLLPGHARHSRLCFFEPLSDTAAITAHPQVVPHVALLRGGSGVPACRTLYQAVKTIGQQAQRSYLLQRSFETCTERAERELKMLASGPQRCVHPLQFTPPAAACRGGCAGRRLSTLSARSAELKTRPRLDGVQQLLPDQLGGGVGRQLEQVHAGGGGGQALHSVRVQNRARHLHGEGGGGSAFFQGARVKNLYPAGSTRPKIRRAAHSCSGALHCA